MVYPHFISFCQLCGRAECKGNNSGYQFTTEEEGQQKEKGVIKKKMAFLPRHTQPLKGSRKNSVITQSCANQHRCKPYLELGLALQPPPASEKTFQGINISAKLTSSCTSRICTGEAFIKVSIPKQWNQPENGILQGARQTQMLLCGLWLPQHPSKPTPPQSAHYTYSEFRSSFHL